MGTAGTKIAFKLKREDAEILAREFDIHTEEFTVLKPFEALVKIEDEVVKVNTPKPVFPDEDYSEAILENCLSKYYRKHSEIESARKPEKLDFDRIE
jgi:hypothetical protein